jgi:hypothetical protein
MSVMDEANQTGAGGLSLHSLPSPPVIPFMRKLVVLPSCLARRALDFEIPAHVPPRRAMRVMGRCLKKGHVR